MSVKRYLLWIITLSEVVALVLCGFHFFPGDPFAAYALLILQIGFLPLFLINILIIEKIFYLIKGYVVYNPSEPEPPLVYQERGHDKLTFCMIRREHETGVFYWVYVPEPEQWQATMPPWAKARRAEILARMIAEMKYDSSLHFEDKP